MYLFCRDSATLFSLAHYIQLFPAFVCWGAEDCAGTGGGAGPDVKRNETKRGKCRTTRHVAAPPYAVRDHRRAGLSEGGFVRPGNGRGNAGVPRRRLRRGAEARAPAGPHIRPYFEGHIQSRAVRHPRLLQGARRAAEEVQGCADGGFRGDPHLPRIHRIARATALAQPPELPERAGGAQLAQGPALAAGPAQAAGAIRGARATPAPAPSQIGSCRNPLVRAGPRLDARAWRPVESRSERAAQVQISDLPARRLEPLRDAQAELRAEQIPCPQFRQ